MARDKDDQTTSLIDFTLPCHGCGDPWRGRDTLRPIAGQDAKLKATPMKFVEKRWGSEEWICNDIDYGYCGKILRINPGQKTSYHYHKVKDEHFYVLDGMMTLYVGDENKITDVTQLCPGEFYRVPPYAVHCIAGDADQELVFMEISSFHRDLDSFRVEFPKI